MGFNLMSQVEQNINNDIGNIKNQLPSMEKFHFKDNR